jgi:hypothetical protein
MINPSLFDSRYTTSAYVGIDSEMVTYWVTR